MYLLVNTDTKEVFQQTFEPTDSQRENHNLFEAKQQTYKGETQTLFDISCDSLTGWDEIPVLDKFLEDCERLYPHLLDEYKGKTGLT